MHMQSRRKFLANSAVATGALPLTSCAGSDMTVYDDAASGIRAPLPVNPDFEALVRFATLAPNGHNTQPWLFTELPTGARITPDFKKRTPVVDPDDHHLYISLGCAAENFMIAGDAFGRPGVMTFVNEGEGWIDIDLATGPRNPGIFYQAIPLRQSTRSIYDGRAVSADYLNLLAAAARIDGVSLTFITELPKREAVLDFVVRGNDIQMDDPRFVNELRDWIRFNSKQALVTGDGLFSKCSGNPVSPAWVGKRFFGMMFSKSTEDKKYIAQMRSSAGIAVFMGDKADKDHWVRVGRSFQRFALQATALGIRHAMINQPVEVPIVRSEFAQWLGLGNIRPDLVVRFGYAAAMPMSMRRPARSVIVT
jgi:hypothetical protein